MNKTLSKIILTALLMLNSCAYVQTHKNVEEMGAYYEGHVLTLRSLRVYHDVSNQKWYLNAHPAKLKLHYPNVHDSVFRQTNDIPSYRALNVAPEFVYYPISQSTARVLLANDGYAQLEVLAEEIQKHGASDLVKKNGMTSYPIRAQMDGDSSYMIPLSRVPRQKSAINHMIGKTEFVLIDIPATLAYNVSIPFIAPFVFFKEFLSKD